MKQKGLDVGEQGGVLGVAATGDCESGTKGLFLQGQGF